MILAQELSINSQSTRIVSDVLDAKDSLKVVGEKIVNGGEIAMQETLMLLDYKVLAQVIKLMEKAKRIY